MKNYGIEARKPSDSNRNITTQGLYGFLPINFMELLLPSQQKF